MSENDPTGAAAGTGTTVPVRRVEWTPDMIAGFWDYWSSRDDRDAWYFSYHCGEALINFAEWAGLLKGEVLDYGFARGLFLPRLLDAGVGVTGAEFSDKAVSAANAKHRDRPNWRGAVKAESLPTPLAGNQFDLIYCVEVVEHLPDEWFTPTLVELSRLLKPGGHVIVTTPNAESLRGAEVLCPSCRSLFHPVQHMRSVTREFLRQSLAAQGLDVLFCRGTSLEPFQKYRRLPRPAEWSPLVLSRVLGLRVLRCLDRISPRAPGSGWAFSQVARAEGAHLCAIGRKPE